MVGQRVVGVVVGLLALAPAGLAAAATPTFEPLPMVGLGGTPVSGGSAQDPTPLTAGVWSGTLTGPGASPASTQWFSYARTMADSTLLLGLVATSPEQYSDAIEVAVVTPDGTTCGSGTSDAGSAAPGSAYGAFLAVGVDEDGDRDSACVSSGELLVSVSRGTSSAESDQPYALRVVEEAPVVTDRGPVPAEAPRVAVPEPIGPTEEPGGSSFDDAPEISSGTWSDVVPEGVEKLWRVRLPWGRAMAVRVDVPAMDQAEYDEVVGATPSISLTPFNPLRDSFGTVVEDTVDEGSYDDEGAMLLEGTPPVAYLNRFDGITGTVPGDYWISVAVSPPPGGRDPIDVPVEITVGLEGEAASPPGFALNVTGPGNTPGPEDYDPATPYLVGDGVFSADVAGTPLGPDGLPTQGTGSEDDTTRRTTGLVVGALSLLSVAAGVVLLRRRLRPAGAR